MNQGVRAGDGSHDFDFFFGIWEVSHRRLRIRLANCTDWEEFDGRCEARALLGGLGNIDDNHVNLPQGAYRAISLRSYDPANRQWAIWWLDGRRPHELDVPVKGHFADGVGEFFADDELNGKSIRVRFRWTRINTETPRWEQAFSPDGGKNWEDNWTMDFRRVAE